jgi:hypothetical protein
VIDRNDGRWVKSLKLVKLRKPKVPDDTQFIETLVWVLDQARQGKVKGYAMVYLLEDELGIKTTEAACPFEDVDRLTVLGAIERMKQTFVKRSWPEDQS